MRWIALLFCLTCVAEPVPDWTPELKLRSSQMKARIDAWLATDAQPAKPLRVVYLYCSDQEPFPKHRERLNRVMTEIQDWYRAQHEAMGFGPVTFGLERDEAGQLIMHEAQLPVTVKSRHASNRRETHVACVRAARKLIPDYDSSFVLVLTTIPDDHGAAPFFGNIIQDRGYCFAVDAPWLDSVYTKVDGPKVWKGKPVGPANSALIGGICHELGHGFGLHHCDEQAAQRSFGESLMGSGNYTWRQERRGKARGTFLLAEDASFLVARPPFAGKMRAFDRQPKAGVDYLKLSHEAGEILMTGVVRSDIPVYAVRVFANPPGNRDYNAISWAAVPDAESGEFSLQFKPRRAAGDHELGVILYHLNGRWTMLNTKLPVARNGKVDLAPANRKLFRLPAPAEVVGKECALMAAEPERAKVGWGRVERGKTPGGPIRLAGKIHPEGLFAHSPSQLVYRLGGKWKTLSVTIGLQDKTAKLATFIVRGDDRVLAEHVDVVAPKALSVDVEGVDKLELIAKPPASGSASSWTVWASPVLSR